MKLVFSRGAVADLERLHAFLVARSPSAASRFVQDLSGAVQSLDVFPNRGRPSTVAGSRELVVPFGRTAYILRYVYTPTRDELIIVRIWHSRETREG